MNTDKVIHKKGKGVKRFGGKRPYRNNLNKFVRRNIPVK